MSIHSGSGRRDALVRAAEEVFAEAGFARATVPQIAARAGVSTGLLYRYFPGKAGLARAIVESEREQTVSALHLLVAHESDARQALALLIQAWADAATADPRRCALIAEIGAEARRDAQIRRTVIDAEIATIRIVSGLLGRVGHEEPDAAAALLLSALDGMAIRIAIEPTWDPQPVVRGLYLALGVHTAVPEPRS